MARLANTQLDVSRVCLGANVFGWTIDEQRSFEVLDAYVEAGGNFIDTADMYGRRGPEGPGSSELILGRWIAARGNRERLVIATKVGSALEHPGLSAQNIHRGADASLRRLGIDCIDLYYSHEDDPDTPLAETLGAYDELTAAGKIRHAGASNYSAARLREAMEVAQREGLAPYVALQPHYNLVERGEYEGELAAVCSEHGLACMPYFGLARGFLTGKYRRDGDRVDSQRAPGIEEKYLNDRGLRMLDALLDIAAARDVAPAGVALAWLLAKPAVLAPIASATSVAQLTESMRALTLQLDEREIARLDAAGA